MVTHWGMSERLGPVAFRDGEEHPFLGKEIAEPREFSEHTAQVIDEEVHASSRRGREGRADPQRAPRQARRPGRGPGKRRDTRRNDIEKMIGPPAHARKTDLAAGDGQVKAAE